jgi:hypothetical protein
VADFSWKYFWNPWWRQTRTYFTPRSVAECRQILTDAVPRFRLGRGIRRTLFSPADFTLLRVTTYHRGNGVKPVAYVKLREVPGRGTLVTVTLTGLYSSQVFWVIWFGFLAVFAVLTAPSVPDNGTAGMIGPLFAAGLAVFGVLLNAFGRFLGRGDPAFLLGFLKEHLRLAEPPVGIELLAQQ